MPGLKATPVNAAVKDALSCVHCHLLLRDPVQTEEGLRLCRSCFEEIQRMPGACADCGIAIYGSSSAFSDRAVKRELEQLLVYCLYHALGCEWEGPLREWEGHCHQCPYQGVECPHDGCGEMVAEALLDDHKLMCPYRLVACVYCGQEVPFNQLQNVHWGSCDEYPVSCDAEGCGKEVPRKQLADHQLLNCVIERCLTCDQKVYRETGRELPTLTKPGTNPEPHGKAEDSGVESHISSLGSASTPSHSLALPPTSPPHGRERRSESDFSEPDGSGDETQTTRPIPKPRSLGLTPRPRSSEHIPRPQSRDIRRPHSDVVPPSPLSGYDVTPKSHTAKYVLSSHTDRDRGISDGGSCIHLSDPLANFRHHQSIALVARRLQSQLELTAADVNQKSHDIHEGHVMIQKLQSEVAELIEIQGKQDSYVTRLKADLQRVTEQVAAVRRPPVDKNLLVKVTQLEKQANDKDGRINQQRRELEEARRQLEALKTNLERNTRSLDELKRSPRAPQRPPTGANTTPEAQYGSGPSETRFLQLERRVEDLARETNITRTHVQEMEIQLQAQVAATYNGSCLWRIPDVAKRRRDALEDRILSIYSPAFYTGRHGYKMCCRMYLNGDGMGLGTHVSVFFVVMKGDYDALLKWPFEHKVSLILVDQSHRKHIVQTFKPTPDSSSFRRPVSDMNVASGCPQFAKLDVLDDDRYIKDNTMYIKCIVDTSKIFHP